MSRTIDRFCDCRRWISDKLTRLADRLWKRPADEDPQLLVARAIAAACEAEDPITGALEVLRPLDSRTVVLMFLHLVHDVATPGRLEARVNDHEYAVGRLRALGAPEEAVGRIATEWALRACLGVSTEASLAWAERRLELLTLDRVESELDA